MYFSRTTARGDGDLMAGRLDGKVCVDHRRGGRDRAVVRALFGAEGATVVGVDLARGRSGDLALDGRT